MFTIQQRHPQAVSNSMDTGSTAGEKAATIKPEMIHRGAVSWGGDRN